MTESTARGLREDYLARLDTAMRALPHGVARDIRAGVAEELEGLDAAGTAERITAIGDPEEIAGRAREEETGGSTTPSAQAPRGPMTTTRGYATVAALVLGFGGILVPVVGWIVGVALVTSSTLWTRMEKAAAILAPIVVTGLSVLVATVLTAVGVGIGVGEDAGNNPLMPSLASWHGFILVGLLLVPASGLWLLWRLRGRTAP